MPPVVKKLIAVLALLVVANIGFVWYGQASFNATVQTLSKGFVEQNVTEKFGDAGPMAPYLAAAGAQKTYKVMALQMDGEYLKKPGASPDRVRALCFLRPAPDLLWAARLDANALVTFNALQSYHAGKAKLELTLFGIVPIATFQGPELARSELARVLAYALFNPLMLTYRDVAYERLDDTHIRARLRDGNVTASVIYELSPEGEPMAVYSEDRVRPGKGGLKSTPWRLRVLEYGERDGLRMPILVEEAWVQKEGEFVYTRYRISDARRL